MGGSGAIWKSHVWTHGFEYELADAFERRSRERTGAGVAREEVRELVAAVSVSAGGDTVEKRRAVRAYLQGHGYRVAQVTLDWEDYLWNSAYARCLAKNDVRSIARLKSSYLSIESSYLDLGRDLAKLVYGHDINHVLVLHLGAFSSTILPDALDLMQKGFTFVTLEGESDPVGGDPDVGSKYGGTLLGCGWRRKDQVPVVMEAITRNWKKSASELRNPR